MTDTKHTPGPLMVDEDHAENGDINFVVTSPEHYVCTIREYLDLDSHEPANARATAARVAGCYNALEGLTDDEVAALPTVDTIRSWLTKRVCKCGGCNGTGQVFHESFDEWWGCPRCSGTGKAP